VKKLVVYGDSILKGVVFANGRYKVEKGVGFERMAQDFSLEIVNRSRLGCTVDKGLELIDKDEKAGIEADFAMLEYGGNDCDFDWQKIAQDPEGEYEPKNSMEIFRQSYLKAIEKLRARGLGTILVNLPPVCPDRYLNYICRDGLSKSSILRWLGDETAIYRFQESYSRMVERIADETGSLLVDLRGAFLQRRVLPPYYCEDGIHPNLQGQGMVHDAIENTLARALQAAH